MSKNYLKLFKDELEKIKGQRPKLLLHVCCGPCSEYPLVLLKEYFQITIYYGNPNIYPLDEYDKRLSELEHYLDILDSDIKLVIPSYDNDYQKELMKFGPMKEGGRRCVYCYVRRMKEAYLYAQKESYDYFTTVMSISNHKNADYINRIGEDLYKNYGTVKYLYADLKKEGGIDKNRELNKINRLYEQDYCGCIFTYQVHASKKEERLSKLSIHKLQDRDKNALFAIFKDEEVSKTYMVAPLKDQKAEDALFSKIICSPRRFDGIYLEDRLIGFINEVESKDAAIEIGYVIAPEYQRQGYMSKALELYMQELNKQGYKMIIAGAFKENVPSIKVMERCGMKKIDKEEDIMYQGKMHHCLYYAKRYD